MKLTYRGTFYEASVLPQPTPNSVGQPKVKLIYRGNAFSYVPPSIEVYKVDVADYLPEFLTYRGITYTQRLYPYQICEDISQQPLALDG